jgi:hypothetical protein
MTEDILAIYRRRDEEALARIGAFNDRFFGAKVLSRSEAETSATGTIYGRLSSHLSLPEVLRRIDKVEIPKPANNEIREILYPQRKRA